MNRVMLKQFRGEETVAGEETMAAEEEGISVERLEQLLSKVQLNDDADESGKVSREATDDIYNTLSEEEKRDFQQFLDKQANEVLDVWQPWWTYRTQLATQGIEEMDNQDVDYNMNRFGQERLSKE